MQRGTRNSDARVKAQCEQNLSSQRCFIQTRRQMMPSAISSAWISVLRTTFNAWIPIFWHWVRCIYIRQMAPPSRVDAAVWVAECKYFEEGIQVWRPHTKNYLNAGGRNLNRWKQRLMLKVSWASCPGLSLVISVQFATEIYLWDQNRRKIHKKTYFGIQGRPRSLNSVAIER